MKLSVRFPPPFLSVRSDLFLSQSERRFLELHKALRSYLSRKEVKEIRDVYRFAARAHFGQKRYSGEPYITHPLTVASMVADMRLDHHTVSAALLHDVIEDTPLSLGVIENRFGSNIARLVEGLTKLRAIRHKSLSGGTDLTPAQSANLQKLALAMANDMRVILIKFCDRLHNLKTVHALEPTRRRLIAKETMLIYAPLANRLGMEKLRMELEDLSFAAAYPIRYRLIEKAVTDARIHRRQYMNKVIMGIEQLLKSKKLKGRVIGRKKNLAGIYGKMTRRRNEWSSFHSQSDREPVSLHQIMDVYGARIITDTVDSCYRVLGVLHAWRKPVPGQFKDYIANPKNNGYQSLHSNLIGPGGFALEVQIRTEEMNQVAETGIAAHFLYKAGEVAHLSPWLSRWLQQVTQLRKESSTPADFAEKFKMGLIPEEVYVYTPAGEVVSLPEGATVIDFAYAVHTDIGARCVACEIDRRPAALDTKLITGQIVKVITDPNAYPDISWNSFVVTPKAISHITHHANMQKNRDARALGKNLLINAFSHYGDIRLKDISAGSWRDCLRQHNLYNKAQFYELLTAGKITPLVAAAALLQRNESSVKQGRLLGIRGQDSIIKYAPCCYPLPDDDIVAVPIKQGSLSIHRIQCRNIVQEKKNKAQRFVAAYWDEKMADKEFLSSIRCRSHNLPDVLSRIVNTLDLLGVRSENIVTEDRAINLRVLSITIRVHNRDHLAQVIRRLRNIRDITSIVRVGN